MIAICVATKPAYTPNTRGSHSHRHNTYGCDRGHNLWPPKFSCDLVTVLKKPPGPFDFGTVVMWFTHTHTHMHTHTHTHTCTHAHIQTVTRTHMHTHTHTRSCVSHNVFFSSHVQFPNGLLACVSDSYDIW